MKKQRPPGIAIRQMVYALERKQTEDPNQRHQRTKAPLLFHLAGIL
jgi:hypothetical protein